MPLGGIELHWRWQLSTAQEGSKSIMPLSPAVSRRNDSYNTNSPSTSVVTIVKNHSHTCTRVTNRGWRLFRSELRIVQLLFEGGDYLRPASIRRNTVFQEDVLPRYTKVPCQLA